MGRVREDKDGAEVVDISERRTGYDEVSQGGEETVTVVLRERLVESDIARRCASERVRVDNRPRVVFGSVDAVGVAGKGGDAGRAGGILRQRRCKPEQEFDVAPAA